MTDDGITLRATEWTVSVSEKRSTGEYENTEPHASLSGEIPISQGELNEHTRRAIKAQLLALQKDLQEVVERAADNRVTDPGQRDWGVPKQEAEP